MSELTEELHERAENAKDPFDKNVAASMAVIAAALAIVTVLGHIFANEELLLQQKASDQWSYYQAKSIRRYESDIAKDFLAALNGAPPALIEKYMANQERYGREGDEVQQEAKKLEGESDLRGRQALRFHAGEVFLEIGIVLASLAILTKRRIAWVAAIGSACVGVAVAGTYMLVH